LDRELKKAYRYCQNLARRKARNFYYSFAYLPKYKRLAIYALYAFAQYGDQLVDENPTRNPGSGCGIADLLYDFQECLQGQYQSPLFQALHDSIRRFNLPLNYFHDLIEGMKSDSNFQGFTSFEELREYCYKVAGTVGLLCVEIFRYKDEMVKVYAENLGIALQLTNIIRDIKEDYHRGRIYLPLEDMARFRYSESDIAKGTINDNFLNLMEFQYQRAKEFYHKAETSLPARERKTQVASEIMKKIYRELLETIKRRGFNIYSQRISLNPAQKIYLALSTYLNIILRILEK
jgi:phytoene synthase